MNYLKTIFITTILLSAGTILNEEKYIAYTTEIPAVPAELPKSTSADVTLPLEELLLPQEMPKEEINSSQEWDKHLSTLSDYWDKTNNIPKDEWKEKAFNLAEHMLEKDKNASETLKSSFLAAINTQTTQITQAIIDLIKQFGDVIAAKLSSLETPLETPAPQEKKEILVVEPSKPSPFEEIKQEPITESFPMPTENPLTAGTTDSGTTQTSEATGTPQEQAENKLLKEWGEQIAKMNEGKISGNELEAMFSKINELAPQLLSSGKKTKPEIKKEFHDALEILGLKKHLPQAELAFRQDAFNRALEPGKYISYDQKTQQFEQEAYQQNLAAERETQKQQAQTNAEIQAKAKKAEEERIAHEKKQKEAEMLTKASILRLEGAGKIETAKAHEQVRVLNEKLAAEESRRKAAEQEAQQAFAKTITQPTVAAKKLAEEKKAAAEQGIFGRAIKAVTDTASSLWYGSTSVPTSSQALAQLEEQQELKNLEAYLASTTKGQDEIERIMQLWKVLQENLRIADQAFDKNNMDKWINTVSILLRELVLTHHIISIENACIKVNNALPLPSTGQDSRKEIINRIKIYLNEAEWKQRTEKQQEEAKKMEIVKQKQEQKEQIRLVQQRIKDEENRIEAEKKKQLMAAADYKNEKQQWKQLLAQLSQNKKATPEENKVQILEAIKKSHSLLNLASAIPSKNKHTISQKLKQKFTLALLDQQKFNENNINIHHYMDQFNKAINQLLD